MTIDEAIERLIIAQGGLKDYHTQEFIDAIKLGIEALKGLEWCRRNTNCPFTKLLPGETKD